MLLNVVWFFESRCVWVELSVCVVGVLGVVLSV